MSTWRLAFSLPARHYCFITSGKGAGGAVLLMAASIIAATEAWL
jgi:hypothetical protein